MSQFIFIILISGLVSFTVTPLLRRIAQQTNFVDNPQARKVHVTPMPMLGGVAIYLGVTVAVIFSSATTTYYQELLGVVIGATMITIVGLIDDRVSLPPLVKMLGQIAAAAILIFSGVQIHLFHNQIANVALTVFWIVAVCNAFNFQDNMDGLAAGLATVASAFFLLLAVIEGLGLVASLAAALLGASVGFLYYNFNPASLFMGDAGSLLLGFMLAVLGIKLEFSSQRLSVTWMIPILILGVPIFDATLVILSRLRRGKHIYEGGQDHTSHRLVSILGMTHARAVMSLYLAATTLGLLAIMLRDVTLGQAQILLAVLALLFVGAIIYLETRFQTMQATASTPLEEPIALSAGEAVELPGETESSPSVEASLPTGEASIPDIPRK